MTVATSNSGPRPSDRFIPWYFVAFFVVLTLLLGGMVWIAVRGNTGLVADHAYEDGIAYNSTLQAIAAQQALGWQGTIEVAPAGKTGDGQPVMAVLTLHDAQGRPLDGVRGRIMFRRPTQSKLDRAAPLTPDGAGRYRATLTLPALGVWEAYAVVEANGQAWQTMRRIVTP